MEKRETPDFDSFKQFEDDPLFQKMKTKFQLVNIQDNYVHENGNIGHGVLLSRKD